MAENPECILYASPEKSLFKRTGARWQQQLIITIWEERYRLWTVCNGEVHGMRSATREQAQRREVDRQLSDIYASRNFMEPEVQGLLEVEQEIHMQRPTHVTQNWLAMAGPVIRRSVRWVKKASLQGVRAVRSYFTRTGDGKGFSWVANPFSWCRGDSTGC
jgi:hypothetical protein